MLITLFIGIASLLSYKNLKDTPIITIEYYLIPEMKKILSYLVNTDKEGKYININEEWQSDNIIILIKQFLPEKNIIIYENKGPYKTMIILNSDKFPEQYKEYFYKIIIYCHEDKIKKLIFKKELFKKIEFNENESKIPELDYSPLNKKNK